MDGGRFDLLVKSVTSEVNRRAAIRTVVGGSLSGLLLGVDRPIAGAGPVPCKRLRHKCRRKSECCSGYCKDGWCRCLPGTTKVDVNTCQVTDGCPATANSCGTAYDCGTNVSGGPCYCFPDADGNGFCGSNSSAGGCNGCTTNADCVAAHGAGFACIVMGRRDCACLEGQRLCMGPCPNPRLS